MAVNRNLFKNMFDGFDSKISSVRGLVNKAVDRIEYDKKTDNFVGLRNLPEEDTTVYVHETEKFRTYMKNIEDILSFKCGDEFSRILERCYDEWVRCECSLEQFRRTEYIRKAYYREHKIYDLIKKTNETVALLDTIKNVQAVKEVVYNNYILSLKTCVDEIKEKHAEYKALPPYSINKNINNVISFIRSECSHIQQIDCLYQAYKIGLNLKDALEIKKCFGKEELDEYKKMTVLLEEFRYGCRDLSEMEKLDGHLKDKTASNAAENETNRRLYERLTGAFTDKWFEAADYTKADSAVNLSPSEKLKEFYSSHMAEANRIIREFEKH